MKEQRELIFREVEKSQNEILKLISSYDQKIHHLFIMTTTSIILLLAFATFIINIFINYDASIQNEIAGVSGIISILFFVISLILFVLTLSPCAEALHVQKIVILNPTKFYKKYGTWTKEKLLEFLISQTSSHFEENKKTTDILRSYYDRAIKRFNGGIIGFMGFIGVSLLTIFLCV